MVKNIDLDNFFPLNNNIRYNHKILMNAAINLFNDGDFHHL